MPAYNTIAWFEIATATPEEAERFYGEVFGWTVSRDETASPDPAYQILNTGPSDALRGGLYDTAGATPNHAVFTILVANVPDTCRRVEQAGGRVERAPQVNQAGVTFAHLRDPSGNHFSVFTPPAR